MAFVAPLIAGAIGAGTIGSALISAGLSLGLGYLARRLGPKPTADGGRGMRLSVRLDANPDREFAFGTVAVAGTLGYHHSYGPNGNDYVQFRFDLLDHECDGLVDVYVDGKLVTLGATASTAWAAGTTVDEYPDAMWIEFHSGAWDQDADAELVARSGGRYASTDRGRGVCYVRVTMKYDAALYKSGQPRFLFVVRGAKLYDWRKDSTNGGNGAHRWGTPSTYEWTDNPVAHLYNYRRGLYVGSTKLAGMSTPAVALPVATWTAAANACDETVGLKAGGTEKRYRASGIATVATEHRAVITDLVTAMAGVDVDTGGVVRPLPGIAQAPVIEITDDDIMARDSVEITPRAPRSNLVNAVFGSFADPGQQYETIALPPRLSPDDEEADGGIQMPEHYALDFVTSGTQGQRVMEIMRRRERHQMRITLTLRSRFCVLEPGDWIEWTSARYGFSDQLFEVTSATMRADLTVAVELRQVSAAIFAWTAGTDELDPLSPATVGGGAPTFDEIDGLAVSAVAIPGAGDETRPGLHVTWTPVDDPTVMEVQIEYRQVGDTTALTYRDLDPSSGSATFLSGVQGGLAYEVRARPVTRPERATSWTGWVSPAANTPAQVVAVAAMALDIDPELIPDAELDAQSALELTIATALADMRGSVSERLADLQAQLIATNEALGEALVNFDRGDTFARREELTRVTEDAALAQLIDATNAEVAGKAAASAVSILESRVTTAEGDIAASASSITSLSTTVGGHTDELTQMLSVDGAGRKRASILMATDGKITGGITLDGDQTASTLDFLASVIRFYSPTVGSGAPVPLLQVMTVGGTPQLVFNGDIIAQSITAGLLDAVQARITELISVLIRSSDSSNFWNLATGDLQVS